MTPAVSMTALTSLPTGSNQFVRRKLGWYPAWSPFFANHVGCSHPASQHDKF